MKLVGKPKPDGTGNYGNQVTLVTKAFPMFAKQCDLAATSVGFRELKGSSVPLEAFLVGENEEDSGKNL